MRDPGAIPGIVLGSAVEGRENVWAGTDSTGLTRDVIVLQLSPEPEIRAAALSALQPLVGCGLGHRQEVLEVTACRVGVALLGVRLAGRSLGARPLAGRTHGSLSPGQLVTLGRPLARELAQLHAQGMAFGAVDLRDEVFLDEAGRPVLVVERFAQRVVAGTCGAPADDARALTGLLRRLAKPEDSRARRQFDEALLATDCGALAAALARVSRPEPLVPVRRPGRGIGQVGPPGTGRRTKPGRVHRHGTPRRPRLPVFAAGWLRTVRGPLAFGVAILAVASVGWLSVRSGAAQANPGAASVSPVGAASTDWRAVVEELDLRRAAYFAGGAVLDDVDIAGSPAYDEDSTRWKTLQDKGLRADGLRLAVSDVQVVSVRVDRVELAVTDALPSYRLVDGTGTVRSTVPGREPVTWSITLRTAGGAGVPWRFDAVERRAA